MDEELKAKFDEAVNNVDSQYHRHKLSDGWIEGPLAHAEGVTNTTKESSYFMQWVHPVKLHRLALRTPLGYRLTYGLSDDVWNSQVGIKIPDQQELTEQVNRQYIEYMKSRHWFREARIFTGGLYEQGEASLLLYIDPNDDPPMPDLSHFERPVSFDAEILKVEAINFIDYKIIQWDDFGEPLMYEVTVHLGQRGTKSVRTHASRMMRMTKYELYQKNTGWGSLQIIYDSIVIHSSIVKAAGEAAFRWGTGHPLILTKNVLDDDEINIIKRAIGTPTRRSWHILPSEYIESFEMKGQAGQMLNLKALSDIALENVIIGSKVPRAVLLGESQVASGTVEDRNFYGLLDELQIELEPFVRRYHERDVNIRKLFNGLPYYEIDWGIRHVLNKMDQKEYEQRQISNALAATTICTVDECRALMDHPPLGSPEGDIIMGIDQMMAMMGMQMMGGQTDEAVAAGNSVTSTDKQANRSKDLEKNKRVNKNKLRENKKKVKDSIDYIRSIYSVDKIAEMMGISKKTYYKMEDWFSKEDG